MELKEGFFDTKEMRLHYLEGPQAGPPLVLLHGATGNTRSWDGIFPALAERWHVFALDLRGHGQSGRADGPEGYHVSAFVSDVLAFLRARVESPAVLVGHSWGAVVALLCGAAGQELVRGLVLEDPPIAVRRLNKELQPFIDFFNWAYQLKESAHTLEELSAALQAANGGAPAQESVDHMAKRLLETDANYLLSTTIPLGAAKGVDFAAAIRQITCPMLLLQADLAKGAALLPEDLDLVLQNARDARVVRFPGAGHNIHGEQTSAYLQALESFFQILE